jgi:osmotically-inducible protein OsmY
MPLNRLAALLFVLPLPGLLAGCAGVALGGAATGASIAHDARTVGTIVEDQTIELKAGKYLMDNKEVSAQVHINFTSYNTIVLVTGEAPAEDLRKSVIEIVSGIEKVRKVYDEIALEAPSTMVSRSSDTLITGKVKAQIFSIKDFEATRVKVVTERGAVYLMGLLSREEADRVTEVARNVGGVQKVVKLFEYTD